MYVNRVGEAIALLRKAIKMHTAQNIGLGSKSKVDSILRLTVDSASYSTNSVNMVVKPITSCSSNNVSKTLTAALQFLVTLIVALNVLMKIVTRIIYM